MWSVLCALIALTVCGSKVTSVVTRTALGAIAKLGLLSNIVIDDRTRLSLSIGVLHIYFWRNVWKYLRSPTKQPLFTVHISSPHIVVMIKEGSETATPSSGGEKKTAALDLDITLLQLNHPTWEPVRPWLYWLSLLWYILPSIGISTSDVAIDVIQGANSVCKIQRGGFQILFRYDAQSSTAGITVIVCKDHSAVVEVQEMEVCGELRNLRVDVGLPVARSASDNRAPVPTNVTIDCELLGGCLDLKRVLQHASSSKTVLKRKDPTSIAPRSLENFILYNILQIIPEVVIKIGSVKIQLTNSAGKEAELISSDMSVHVWDSSKPSRLPDSDQRTAERKVVLSLNQVGLSLANGRSNERQSRAHVDALKVELDTCVSAIRSTVKGSGIDRDSGHSLTWSTRINSDSRLIRVAVNDDLAPWFQTLYEALSVRSSLAETMEPSFTSNEEVEEDYCQDEEQWMDVQVQFKVLRTEVTCLARDISCSVLPNRVPDIGLSVDEIVVFAHPFLSDDSLGVRVKADIQGSRVKLFYVQPKSMARTSFLSVDYVRALIDPVYLYSRARTPADVELEAEWLEARWTPEAMHSIGGLLDLGIFLMKPLLTETYDWTDDDHWSPRASTFVPEMKIREDITGDTLSGPESIKFRCKLNRAMVMFSHTHRGRSFMECVSVETLSMSVEETTGRFRLSVFEISISGAEGDRDIRSAQSLQQHRVMRRRPSTLQELTALRRASTSSRAAPTTPSMPTVPSATPYFTVKVFALEEVRIPSCPMKVLDMFVDGVVLLWDMASQERVVELIRRITYSSWEMLYRMRSSYGVHCTSHSSRYNRDGGLSVAADDEDECTKRERLLGKLISAGGDGLSRIHATNIRVEGGFESTSVDTKEYSFKLEVGVMASNDLPELWLFEDVVLTVNHTLPILSVNQVRVRHTVGQRQDYVFGFFEESLRLRQRACGRLPAACPREDGMMIDIDSLRLCLSLQVDLEDFARAIQGAVLPHVSNHLESFASPWRPQEDEFFRFFHRIPQTPGQPKVWLQLQSTVFKCVDSPMEAWLGHVYPVWAEELAEQELRTQLLEEQVATLKLTSAELLQSEDAVQGMKKLLLEKHSKIYVHKIKKLESSLHYHQAPTVSSLHNGHVVSVHVGAVTVNIEFEANERTISRRIMELDDATPALHTTLSRLGIDTARYVPAFQLALSTHLSLEVRDVMVRMRDFPTPIATIESVKVAGDMIIAAADYPRSAVPEFGLTSSLRLYADMSVAIQRPTAFFGPGYVYTIQELASIVERVLPTLVLDVDARYQTMPWDIARRLLHGRVDLSVEDTAVRLLATSSSFESGDYLEVALQRVHVQCNRVVDTPTVVEIDRLSAKIEPDAVTNIMEITSLKVDVDVKWGTAAGSGAHFLYPVILIGDSSTPPSLCVDLSAVELVEVASCGSIRVHECLRRYEASQFSLSISAKIAPKHPTDVITRRDIAARSAIVLYTKNVEWLIRFGRLYQTIGQFSFPGRKRRQREGKRSEESSNGAKETLSSEVILDKFLAVVETVSVEKFAVVGLDVALYHSEKSPVGVRACINDQFEFAGALQTTKHEFRTNSTANSSKIRRQIPLKCRDFEFVLRDISAAVSDIQVRICTPSTGSRGQSLVSVRDVTLDACGDQDEASHPHVDLDFATMHSVFNAASSPVTTSPAQVLTTTAVSQPSSRTASLQSSASGDSSRTKSKKNILDHFDIAHHNPYHFSNDEADEKPTSAENSPSATEQDNDSNSSSQHDRATIREAFVNEFGRQGFILGLAASEVRVLITLDTVETMIDIVENWLQVIRACLPEMNRIPDDLVEDNVDAEPLTPRAHDLGSPKKATSLADDPKFGAIFHAANEIPTTRLQSFHLDQDDSDLDSKAPGTAAVAEPFMIVRFMDIQISFQNHQHKGSVLLALSCGSLKHSRSRDMKHELIDLSVDGLQLFTAPLDIDVKSRVIWLRTLADGSSYCPSSYGLLKQVVAPIPAHVMIWVDTDLTVSNRIDLQIPTVQIGVNIDSKIILQNLILALMDVITAKLAQYQSPDYAKMLQGFRNPASIRASIQQLLVAKQQLKWQIAEIHWRQACRWNYQATERANVVIHAADGMRVQGLRDMDLNSTSPMVFMQRRLSSASMISSMPTSISLTGTTATQVETSTDDLQQLQQQHASMVEVLRSLIATEIAKRQPNPNVQLVFGLQKASLTLSAANSDIVSAAMTNLKVKLKMYEDQSGMFALTIDDVACHNLCPNTPYPELLLPLKHSQSWSGGETFVRVDAEVASPVGGIKVVRHFELNFHPMQVCITYDLILQLVAFFTAVSSTTDRQEEKKAEIRSQFLAAPQAGYSSNSEGILQRAVKVAGKAAHPSTYGIGRTRAGTEADAGADSKNKVIQTLQDEAAQWLMRIAQTANEKSDGKDGDSNGSGDKDVNEMRDRAKNNIMFKRIRLGTVEVNVSFKNKRASSANAPQPLPLEEMRGFEVKIHSLVYCDKTCSLLDLLLRMRRDILLDVLSQVGRNFTNVANFLRDQFDISRWAAFDALAPLKSLSSAITGGSHAVAPAVQPSTASFSTSERTLSIDMLPQQRPRISSDAPSVKPPNSPADTSKLFQLELPENHPSRKKKHNNSSARTPEPTTKLEPSITIIDTLESPKATSPKSKKLLGGFFSKSKKTVKDDPQPSA